MKRIFRVIISVVLLGASLIGVVLLVWPKYQDYSLLKAQIEEKKDRLERGEQVLSQLKKTQETVSARQSDFDRLEGAIPQDAGLPAVYEHIHQLGIGSGLVMTSIEGTTSEDLERKVATLVFEVKFVGSYEGLKSFLEEARRSSRILNVNTLSVSGQSDISGALELKLELFAYANP